MLLVKGGAEALMCQSVSLEPAAVPPLSLWRSWWQICTVSRKAAAILRLVMRGPQLDSVWAGIGVETMIMRLIKVCEAGMLRAFLFAMCVL